MTLCRDALPSSAAGVYRCFARRSADGSHVEHTHTHRHALPRRSAGFHDLPSCTAVPAGGGSEVTTPRHGAFLTDVGGLSVGPASVFCSADNAYRADGGDP
jgi:hypothetical protein